MGSCFDSVGKKVERSVSAVSALFLEDAAVAGGSVSGVDVFSWREIVAEFGAATVGEGGVLCFVSGDTVVSTSQCFWTITLLPLRVAVCCLRLSCFPPQQR